MKIAFSTEGHDLNGLVDSRFGRCSSFLVYETETDEFTMVDNTINSEREHGAGIQAAATVIDSGAKVVISGHLGPKASSALKAQGIQCFQCENMSIANALAAYNNGELECR